MKRVLLMFTLLALSVFLEGCGKDDKTINSNPTTDARLTVEESHNGITAKLKIVISGFPSEADPNYNWKYADDGSVLTNNPSLELLYGAILIVNINGQETEYGLMHFGNQDDPNRLAAIPLSRLESGYYDPIETEINGNCIITEINAAYLSNILTDGSLAEKTKEYTITKIFGVTFNLKKVLRIKYVESI
ncbi:MAG: hypothetical protein LBH29_02425 [Elusimicrobiota bacterium]|jgi:hypothetical protein|nr:hypothetical protein [Elusimicrobiota bacterium]